MLVAPLARSAPQGCTSAVRRVANQSLKLRTELCRCRRHGVPLAQRQLRVNNQRL